MPQPAAASFVPAGPAIASVPLVDAFASLADRLPIAFYVQPAAPEPVVAIAFAPQPVASSWLPAGPATAFAPLADAFALLVVGLATVFGALLDQPVSAQVAWVAHSLLVPHFDRVLLEARPFHYYRHWPGHAYNHRSRLQ